MESQHSVGVPNCCDFPRLVIILEKSRPEVGSRVKIFKKVCLFGKKDPLRANFHKYFPKGFTNSQNHVMCANFVKFGWREIDKVVRNLPDKKNKKVGSRSRSRFCADRAQKLPGQLQTIYSECPKFHPNPFTSGRVIAEIHEHRSNAPQSVSNIRRSYSFFAE